MTSAATAHNERYAHHNKELKNLQITLRQRYSYAKAVA